MSSTAEIIERLQRYFWKRYATFLFAPKFIQEVLYIDSQLSANGPPEITLNLNEFCDKVIEGVERSFLILGESGSGKTSFALKLCQTLWGKSGVGGKIIIPIYVYLPTTVSKLKSFLKLKTEELLWSNSESEFDIVKILMEELRLNGIEESEGQIVFILDSFDEIGSFSQRSKLVQSIWLATSSWLAQVSILTCSRPEAVPKSKLERQEIFEFVTDSHHVGYRKYSEYVLKALSRDEISNFLEKMEMHIIPHLRNCKDEELIHWAGWGALKGKIQDWKSGDYIRWYFNLPDLRKLSENPYILTLICQTLPGIVVKLKDEEKVLKRLCKTTVGIFHSFTEQIFEYQARRISLRPDNLKPGTQNISHRDWLIYFRAYAQNLAGKWFNYANEENVVKMSDKAALDSSLIEPVLHISQLEKLEKEHKDLFPPRLTYYEDTERGLVISCSHESHVNPILEQNMKILRDACNGSILVYSANENEYKFIHRSMLEYFASEQTFESSLAEYDLILGQNMDNSSAIYGGTGFGRALIKDRDILSQLVERMSVEYKKILFKLVPVSKTDSKLHRISANAITILNKAHVCFSGQDYRDIQIQGADLRQSICARTDFRGANLANVQFGGSYLVGAQFQGACMDDVDFGESPFLKLSSTLNSMVSYRDHENDEENWVIATADGSVRIWNTMEEEVVVPQRQLSSDTLDACISLLDSKVAVWTESTKDPVSPLLTAKVTYEVSMYDLIPKWKFIRKQKLLARQGMHHVYIQFCLKDKCVFIYSTCHLEVLSYLPKIKSHTENGFTIGNGVPNNILTFVSIVDKNSDILIACTESSSQSQDGRIVVYKNNEACNNFEVKYILPGNPFSSGAGKFKLNRLYRALFKPDGSGLAIYNGPGTNLQIYENYSEVISPIHSEEDVFLSFAFDKTGKYLAGSTSPTFTVIIWNIPSGTIHRQFDISTMCFPSRFSNPLAFSSDSKALALGGSELHSDPTMKLKCIDEISICDLLRQKSVDDFTVSDDGTIVVIGGIYYHASYISNYIEIFNFPFQTTNGLWVALPKELGIDRCLIGITDSTSTSAPYKKIIVIQEEYCRAIIICSFTGSILQNFRFEETLDVNSNQLSCLNKQASLCCIYSSTQGYYFWEIFENDNFEIIFNRRTELDLLGEIDEQVKVLRFDYTGRYLQIVKPALSKIIIFDTKEEIIEEKNMVLSYGIEIPIQSVDTDMINNIVFSCTQTELLIFSPIDSILFERLDCNFTSSSGLHFDPSSGWLFATSLADSSLVIFQKQGDRWGLALQIPMWFQGRKCVIYEINNKISALVSGQRDLCYIEFDRDNCHSWRILWSMKQCHKLKSGKCNVEGVLCLSKRNAGLLKGHGSTGAPLQNRKYKYLAFSDWCQEIFGTARSKFHSPYIKTTGNNFFLSEDMWVVSLVGKFSNIIKWRAHVYFIVEGIKNNRRFITRIHLIYSKELKEVSIVVSPIVDRTPLNEHSWEESKYIEFVYFAEQLSAQQYGMSREECAEFLRNIQSDMQVKLNYNFLTDNCGVWCERQLKKVGREIRFEGFTSALIFPRVLKLLKEMRFW